MTPASIRRRFVQALAKHLPPSAARLRLLDIGGQCGDILALRRADLDIHCLAADDLSAAEVPVADAIVAYDCHLDSAMLKSIAASLRPGGRFIAVLPHGQVSERWLRLLEAQALRRILVEPAVDGAGVLIRGEKAHNTSNTLQRIHSVARADAEYSDLDRYRGHYLHFLVRQLPNKPVWKLASGEALIWRALALTDGAGDAQPVLLAFSSLPRAVGFLQPAVLIDRVRDVNKVGKFTRQAAVDWGLPLLLNPTLDDIRQRQLIWLYLDPKSAAAADE